MSKLLNYLNTLDKDAAARDAHKKDPEAAMTKRGLSAVEQIAFMSGNKNDLAAMVGVTSDSMRAIMVHVDTFNDVQPQPWECAAKFTQVNRSRQAT